MLLRCRDTVFSLTKSSLPMARLVTPVATSRRISTSRVVSRSGAASRRSPGQLPDMPQIGGSAQLLEQPRRPEFAGRAGRLLASSRDARCDPRRGRLGCRRRGAASASPSPTSSRRTVASKGSAATAGTARRVTERATVVVGADGTALGRGRSRPTGDVLGATAAAGRLLRLLERPADGRPVRHLRAPGAGLRGVWPTSDGLTVVIAGWPYAEFARNRTDGRAPLPRHLRPGAGVRGAARGRAGSRAGSSAPLYRTSSASRSARDGRWSVTRATSGTSSPARACRTRSATRSCARPASPTPWRGADRSRTRWPTTRRARDGFAGRLDV